MFNKMFNFAPLLSLPDFYTYDISNTNHLLSHGLVANGRSAARLQGQRLQL